RRGGPPALEEVPDGRRAARDAGGPRGRALGRSRRPARAPAHARRSGGRRERPDRAPAGRGAGGRRGGERERGVMQQVTKLPPRRLTLGQKALLTTPRVRS